MRISFWQIQNRYKEMDVIGSLSCLWGSFILSHHPAKFGVLHRPYGIADNMVYNISSNSNSNLNSNSNAEIPMLSITVPSKGFSYFSSGLSFLMYFNYILRLVCHFNVIFFIVPSDDKRKLPASNQNLERDL